MSPKVIAKNFFHLFVYPNFFRLSKGIVWTHSHLPKISNKMTSFVQCLVYRMPCRLCISFDSFLLIFCMIEPFLYLNHPIEFNNAKSSKVTFSKQIALQNNRYFLCVDCFVSSTFVEIQFGMRTKFVCSRLDNNQKDKKKTNLNTCTEIPMNCKHFGVRHLFKQFEVHIWWGVI